MSNNVSSELSFELLPEDNTRMANLCGQFNEHLHQLETYFDVKIEFRGNFFHITGDEANANATMVILKDLYAVADKEEITPTSVQLHISESQSIRMRDNYHLMTVWTARVTLRMHR